MKSSILTIALLTLALSATALAYADVSGNTKHVRNSDAIEVAEADTPRSIVRTYLRTMSNHNDSSSLSIYTRDTQAMLKGWRVTPAQMDNVAGTYRRCSIESEQISGDRAVVRYPIDARQCAPFSLQREGAKWRLDFTVPRKAIRFGRNNA
jgi:uncharacterized protein